MLNFTGGEPTCRDDVNEIGSYAKRKKMITQLNTNGTLLNRFSVRELDEAFDVLSISIDGWSSTHDEIRGVIGTWEKVVGELRKFQNEGHKFLLNVSFVITKRNYKEMFTLASFIKGMGVDHFSFAPVSGNIPDSAKTYGIPSEEIEPFMYKLKQKTREWKGYFPSEKYSRLIPIFLNHAMPRICDAGRLYALMNASGDVFICPMLSDTVDNKIGSLLNVSVDEMFSSDRFKALLKRTESCEPCLGGCTTMTSLPFRQSIVSTVREEARFVRS
jgi:MoaA/NifB/PqqE/SkfB family radical SAM enzyme